MRTCTHCKVSKPENQFSWQDRQHRWRDSRCKACRASLKRVRTKPKNTRQPYRFPRGLSARMHDHLTRVELAYIAGIIDGEGSICSSQPRSNRAPLSIVVCMIHRPTIEWLHEKCGGGCWRTRTNQANARQSWVWLLKGARSTSLLQRLLPFLRTKRDEAGVALELGRTLWSENVRGRVTAETLIQRQQLGQLLRDLKRREWVA
jgi:hypothetical protein